jgi:alkylation response protein AidB-like acyl-CoA dehydrogenase
MNFDFSDEQKQLRTEARRFLEDRCSPAAVRTVLEGSEPFDRALWSGLAEMGFLGAAIPEAYGGLGLGIWKCASSPRNWDACWPPFRSRPRSISRRS